MFTLEILDLALMLTQTNRCKICTMSFRFAEYLHNSFQQSQYVPFTVARFLDSKKRQLDKC